MRTTPIKQVMDAVIRLHGLNPRTIISEDVVNTLIEHINNRVEMAVLAWDWPEWNLTEERAFRQVWNSTTQFYRTNPTTGNPDQFFYLGDSYSPTTTPDVFGANFGYYQVVSTAPSDPPIGTLPTDTTYFELITIQDTYIAYDQPCKRSIGQVLGIYSTNPISGNHCSNFSPYRYKPTESGIFVVAARGCTAFVWYQMPIPKYTMIPYVVGKTYGRGDLVFDPPTGECFQAITSTTSAPSDTSSWNRVPFLSKWFNFVRYGAFADSQGEVDLGKTVDPQTRLQLGAQAEAKAMSALQQQIDSFVMQGERLTWRPFGNRRSWHFNSSHSRYWSEALPWGGGTVISLTDQCQDDLGWIYPAPSSGFNMFEYHPEIVALLASTHSPSLDELITVGRLIDSVVKIVIDPSYGGTEFENQEYRLMSGTYDSTDPGQVQPLDYSVTNSKYWMRTT